MHAELSFPLSIEYIRSASADDLLVALKTWLIGKNPTCLLHPHGFFVVRLAQTETADWRFHFWRRGPRTITGMPAFIHTHDRLIESRVLQGELTNVIYDVSIVEKDGQPLYEVEYDGDRYEQSTTNHLNRTGALVSAVVRDRNTIRKGERYCVERSTYHEAFVPERLSTATLVCMHSRSLGPIHVVGCDGYPDRINFKRFEYSAVEFTNLIGD